MGRVILLGRIEHCGFCNFILNVLQRAGHQALRFRDLNEAMEQSILKQPDLLLLDLGCPGSENFATIRTLRGHENFNAPVVVISCSAEKATVVRARAEGAQDYLLKSCLDEPALLKRLNRFLNPKPRQVPLSAPSSEPMRLAPEPVDVANRPVTVPAIQPIGRDQVMARIRRFTESRTLAGAVSQVLALANSPRGSLADLVTVLKRDTVLAARVLHLANSAAFASQKPCISTIEEAVRNVGLNTIKNVAMSVGVFQHFPPDDKDGFNTVRCWQHCFATAALMDLIFPQSEAESGVAHLVGLCHDLPEIVLRHCFSSEFAEIREHAAATGKAIAQIEAEVLGDRAELIAAILQGLSLPQPIAAPIEAYLGGQSSRLPMTRALLLADLSAHGLLLAPSLDAPVRPISLPESNKILTTDQKHPDPVQLRSEILIATDMLADLSSEDRRSMAQPLIPRRNLAVWYARHASFGAWDPLESALQLLCNVQTHDHLPRGDQEIKTCQVVIAAVPHPQAAAFLAELQRLPQNVSSLLFVSGARPSEESLTGLVERLPVSLERLSQLLGRLCEQPASSHSQTLAA